MLFRSQGSVCLLLALVAACVVVDLPQAFAEKATRVLPQSDWEDRIGEALDAKLEWDFSETPLREVCRTMQEKLGVDVALDVKALEDYGIEPSAPITRTISGISTRSFLRLILSELELTYTTRDGALWITTSAAAEARLATKVYPLGDLLARDPTLGESPVDYDSLIQAITSIVKPDSWDFVGGPGAIEGIYESLVVSQTPDVHEQLAEFIATYREIIANDNVAEGPKQTCYVLGEDKTTATIRQALDQLITAKFKDASLKEVIKVIAEQSNIPIVVNNHALEDFGINASVPITGEFVDTPLHFLLVRMLNEQELTYMIRKEVVEVTTPEYCGYALSIGLYPVRDLVEIAKALPGDAPGANYDFDSLIRVIASTVAPDSWDEVGGPGAIEPLLAHGILIIAQTQDVHEQISTLLTSLRAAKKLESNRLGDLDPDAYVVRTYLVDTSQSSSSEIGKLVVRALEPAIWNEATGTFVQGLGGKLIVKHCAAVHRQIRQLLETTDLLRRYQPSHSVVPGYGEGAPPTSPPAGGPTGPGGFAPGGFGGGGYF